MTTSSQYGCKHCDRVFSKLNGLRVHARREHGLNAQQCYNELNSDARRTCKCGAQLKFWSFIKGYEPSCGTCRKRTSQLKAAATRKKQNKKAWNSGKTKATDERLERLGESVSQTRINKPIWNKNKTAKDDERIAKNAIAISIGLKHYYDEHKHWSAGLTAESDERLRFRGRQISHAQHGRIQSQKTKDKISATRKKRYPAKEKVEKYPDLSKGRGWQTGLTKDDDPRLFAISEGVRAYYADNAPWSAGFTKETHDSIKNIADANRLSPDIIRERFEASNFTLLSPMVEYVTQNTKLRVRCNKCRHTQLRSLYQAMHTLACDNCTPRWTSAWQREIFAFVRSLSATATISDRTIIPPLELDIFVPEHNLAVECHGIYWHSMAVNNDGSSHIIKYNECMNRGISLLQIFEDEWRDKPHILKSLIRYRCNATKRIHTRKCTYHTGIGTNVRYFFAQNHLDGYAPATIALWLQQDDMIIAAMTLRRPKHRKWKGHLEIARFATACDTSVPGALSRLLKHAKQYAKIRGYKGIMTYADDRLGQHTGYAACGMIKQGKTPQSWWWTDFVRRYNRFKFRAKNGISEKMIARQNKIHRIYGCTNTIYTINV